MKPPRSTPGVPSTDAGAGRAAIDGALAGAADRASDVHAPGNDGSAADRGVSRPASKPAPPTTASQPAADGPARTVGTDTRTDQAAADPMLQKIVDALEQIRAEEFDYEILRAASDVMGQDVFTSWRPSLSYLPPEKRDGDYHVTVYAQGACESCPIKKSHVGSIEPKLRDMVGADNIYVHDYFDWFDTQFSVSYGD